MRNSNIYLKDYNFYENRSKIFDMKFNPQKSNELAFCDFEGKVIILEYQENENDINKLKLNIVKKYNASEESIHTLNFSSDGQRNITLNLFRDFIRKFYWRT